VNGSYFGSVANGGVFYRDVPPGHYHIAPQSYGHDFNQDRDVDLAPGHRLYVKPDLNTLFCQATDITPLLAKFERPWHYASGGRGALRRVWVAALPAAARSA